MHCALSDSCTNLSLHQKWSLTPQSLPISSPGFSLNTVSRSPLHHHTVCFLSSSQYVFVLNYCPIRMQTPKGRNHVWQADHQVPPAPITAPRYAVGAQKHLLMKECIVLSKWFRPWKRPPALPSIASAGFHLLYVWIHISRTKLTVSHSQHTFTVVSSGDTSPKKPEWWQSSPSSSISYTHPPKPAMAPQSTKTIYTFCEWQNYNLSENLNVAT